MSGTVRVRFAPSPTGYLHVGGARTAIFNWLYARHTGGAFVLRIEDTDVDRSTSESEDSLIADLTWLGLEWDEGPHKGGPHEPYRQSERQRLYADRCDALVQSGWAYPCFCTDDELARKREQAHKEGRAPQYDGTCRNLDAETVAARRAAGAPEAIRFRVPEGKVVVDDVVRGAVELGTDMVGDFVILRSNGLPTYNFAAAVDDHAMGITHVIRGEEHLSNTLRQVLIYDAMGAPHPVFAHVPLILAPDRSKLSKRHGASSVGELRERGILSEAAFNYLVLLGWSHPDGAEVLSREEIVNAFSLDRVGKAAAVFDVQKLAWMNGQHIRRLEPATFSELVRPFVPAALASAYDESHLRAIADVLQDSVETLSDFPARAEIFAADLVFDEEAQALLQTPAAKTVIAAARKAIAATEGELTPEAFKAAVKKAGAEVGVKGKDLFFPIRAALTGSVHGPDLSRVASIKGADAVLRLLDDQL